MKEEGRGRREGSRTCGLKFWFALFHPEPLPLRGFNHSTPHSMSGSLKNDIGVIVTLKLDAGMRVNTSSCAWTEIQGTSGPKETVQSVVSSPFSKL